MKRRVEPPYGTPIVADDVYCETIKGATKVLDLSCEASAAMVCGFPQRLPGVREWFPQVTPCELGGPGAPGPSALCNDDGFDAATAFLSLHFMPEAAQAPTLKMVCDKLRPGGVFAGGVLGEGSSEPVVNAFSAIAKRKAFKDCFPADFEYHTCATKITMSSRETWEAAMTKAGFVDVKVAEFYDATPMPTRDDMEAYLRDVWAATAKPHFSGDGAKFAKYLNVVASEIKAVRELTEIKRDHHYYETFALVPTTYLEITAKKPRA